MANDYLTESFQSTRPLRGETDTVQTMTLTLDFSIHSPLAGRDLKKCGETRLLKGFQSTRPLRGETYEQAQDALVQFNFQSTRPLRGETMWVSCLRR